MISLCSACCSTLRIASSTMLCTCVPCDAAVGGLLPAIEPLLDIPSVALSIAASTASHASALSSALSMALVTMSCTRDGPRSCLAGVRSTSPSNDTDASTTSDEPNANSLESSTVVLPPSMSPSTSPPATGEDFPVATLDAGRLGGSDTAITIDTCLDSELERCLLRGADWPILRSSSPKLCCQMCPNVGLLQFHERGPNFADGF